MASGTAPFFTGRAASDQGPGHHTVTYGVVAARRPQMEQTVQHRTHRNLCCTGGVRRLRASQALTDCDVALLAEQTRGQTRGGVRQV